MVFQRPEVFGTVTQKEGSNIVEVEILRHVPLVTPTDKDHMRRIAMPQPPTSYEFADLNTGNMLRSRLGSCGYGELNQRIAKQAV